MKFDCLSVVGGWQTQLTVDGVSYMIGPVFNSSTDLWDWQRQNLQETCAHSLRRHLWDDEKAAQIGDALAAVMKLKRPKGSKDHWLLGEGYLEKSSAGVARTALNIILEN